MAGSKKKHVVPREDKWKFNRRRKGDDHAKNCNDGYMLPKNKETRNVHHVLCVCVCQDKAMPEGFTQDDKSFVKCCLANTEWDINGGGNNIGLPKKWAYIRYPEDDGADKWGNLPCHQVDHNIYITEVISWMERYVWNKMKNASKEKKCEYLEGKKVAKLFDAGSKKWKGFLKERGEKYGGTKKSLDYCLHGERNNMLNDNNWHVPFSMCPTPSEIPKRKKPKLRKNEKRLVSSDRDELLKMEIR